MVGGTGGPHLGSFSLIDVLSHGRACALLNPYYTVLFAPVIQTSSKCRQQFLRRRDTSKTPSMSAEEIWACRREGHARFFADMNFPTTLKEQAPVGAYRPDACRGQESPIEEQTPEHADSHGCREGDVDRLMRPILEAAFTGDLSLIP